MPEAGRERLAMMSPCEEPTERFYFRILVQESLELRVVHPA